jgi:hypothetical protein
MQKEFLGEIIGGPLDGQTMTLLLEESATHFFVFEHESPNVDNRMPRVGKRRFDIEVSFDTHTLPYRFIPTDDVQEVLP